MEAQQYGQIKNKVHVTGDRLFIVNGLKIALKLYLEIVGGNGLKIS